jgi:hypothetical protein
MSLVSHGSLGLVDNLRTFFDLVEESAAERRALLEIAPGIVSSSSWDFHSGTVYKQPARHIFDGVLRDIVAVDTSLGPLTRVETEAECLSTPGTYYYDIDEAGEPFDPVPHWDGDEVAWDDVGAVWDLYEPGPLFVHLPDGSNPADATVVLGLGFYYSTRGEVHPHLSSDKLADGGFETAGLPDWTQVLTGTGTSTARDTVVKRVGVASLRLTHASSTALATATRRQERACVVGKHHRLSGYYMTETTNPAGLDAILRVRDNVASMDLTADGRTTIASGTGSDVPLRPTAGQWRRFAFDFIAHGATLRYVLLATNNTGAAASGNIYFDDVKLQRIYGFNYYEPRLGATSVPETESAKAAVHFGGKTIGLGQVSLLNGDGALDVPFGQLLLLNRPVALFDGGGFSDGQELPREDHRPGFLGYTRDVEAGDQAIRFDLEDLWTFSQEPLPPRVYSRTTTPNVRGEYDGKARPLLFGRRSFYESAGDSFAMIGPIQPVRIDVNANGYGIYEICDPTNAPGPLEPFPGS